MKRLVVLCLLTCLPVLAVAGSTDTLTAADRLAYLKLMDESLVTIELSFQGYLAEAQLLFDEETKSKPGVQDEVDGMFKVSMETLEGIESTLNAVEPPPLYRVIHDGTIAFCSKGRRALASEHVLLLKGKYSPERTAKDWEKVFSGIGTIRSKISKLMVLLEREVEQAKPAPKA